MHRAWLDAHPPSRTGPLQRAPASLKLVVALLLLIVLAASPVAWPLYAFVAAALLVLAGWSHVPLRTLLLRLLLIEPFVIGVALLTLFQPNGLAMFAALLVRSTLSISVVVLLGAVTPFPELLDVLRRARVPALMITTLALMHRYLYVLVDESSRMRTARASRTFAPAPRLRAWSTLTTIVSQLFLRTSSRSERIYAAMCSRGWQ